ncbi:hypothetical protein G6F35_018033 [Rhizopus arrhizus]|nr:hypothetical protein G6F35_018033 [Rhizopus arrhizus]
MRAEDHQVQLPMVVSKVSKGAKYKADGTDMGFEPVKVLAAADVSAPVQATDSRASPLQRPVPTQHRSTVQRPCE